MASAQVAIAAQTPMVAAQTQETVEVVASKPSQGQKKNRIQVSNTKKPLFFYVNLAKKYMQQHNEVELSALGTAITTVVTVAEILKNNGFAFEKRVTTSTVGMKDESKGRTVQKAKIEIVLGKTEKFDSLMTANAGTDNSTHEINTDHSSRETTNDKVSTEASGDNKEEDKQK